MGCRMAIQGDLILKRHSLYMGSIYEIINSNVGFQVSTCMSTEYSEYSCIICHKPEKLCSCNTHPKVTPLAACCVPSATSVYNFLCGSSL